VFRYAYRHAYFKFIRQVAATYKFEDRSNTAEVKKIIINITKNREKTRLLQFDFFQQNLKGHSQPSDT